MNTTIDKITDLDMPEGLDQPGRRAYETGKTHEPYGLYEGMQAKLREAGLYFEECTRWYSAVYSAHREEAS